MHVFTCVSTTCECMVCVHGPRVHHHLNQGWLTASDAHEAASFSPIKELRLQSIGLHESRGGRKEEEEDEE